MKFTSLLLIFVLFLACRKKEIKMENANKSITYLALGDSYTKGECESTANSFPYLLAERLKAKKISLPDPKVIAQTGWRTDQLLQAIDAADLQDTFGLVTLLIGVNNQFQGRSLEVYKTEFKSLLLQAIQLAKHRKERVVVLSIPDYGVTPFGSGNTAQIAMEIDSFNVANKHLTDSLGVRYLDVTTISREAATDPSLLCTDNLHPSAKMYARWVDLLEPIVLGMLE